MCVMQYEAYSITSEVFQPKMFNLNPIKLSDFTTKLQETLTRRSKEKLEDQINKTINERGDITTDNRNTKHYKKLLLTTVTNTLDNLEEIEKILET